MSKTETENKDYLEVTVKLPREIVEFLQKWTAFVGEPLDSFFKDAIISEVHGMLKNDAVFATPWSTTEQVIKTHHLEKYFADKKEATAK